MALLARENKAAQNNETASHAYGRKLPGEVDFARAEQKLNQQQLYKQELQRQIMEKEARKKQEQEKIRKEDEKFMREIQQLNRKEGDKERKNRKAEDYQEPSPPKREMEKQIAPHPSLRNFSREPQRTLPQVPQLGFESTPYEHEDNSAFSAERRRLYMHQQNEQLNNYYEERIRKHKEQLNQKLDELFHHIHATKDNVRADEEIEKIKRKLRAKQASPLGESAVGGELQFENKFFHIPKKSGEVLNRDRSRVLDYSNLNKFRVDNSRLKNKTQNDDLYGLPDRRMERDRDDWGREPGQRNFLADREAIDFQVDSLQNKIDVLLGDQRR